MAVEKVLVALMIVMLVTCVCVIMGAVILMTVFGWIKYACVWFCSRFGMGDVDKRKHHRVILKNRKSWQQK